MTDEDQNIAASEAIAEMLGDPLPPDWRDACAVQARQDHLTALACDTAEAAAEWLVYAATEIRPGQPVSIDDQRLDAFVDALERLDRGWRRYVHDTQRDDTGAIVNRAAEFTGGALAAEFVERSLERLRAIQAERLAAFHNA